MDNTEVSANEQKLWDQMAELTLSKCKQKCKIIGSCCDAFYCQIAKDCASEYGIELKNTGNEIPFLSDDGKCIAPPFTRQMCSLHQCDINGIGQCIEDPEWTSHYFDLRNQLESIGFDEHYDGE